MADGVRRTGMNILAFRATGFDFAHTSNIHVQHKKNYYRKKNTKNLLI